MSKEKFTRDLIGALQEATAYTTDRLILGTLVKNGKVTIEEAKFFNELTQRVIAEAAEDFVPEDINPDAAPEQGSAPLTLTDEAGNVYSYNPDTGELLPMDGGAPEPAPAPGGEMQESTVIGKDTKEVGTQGDAALKEVQNEGVKDAKTMVKAEDAGDKDKSLQESTVLESELSDNQRLVMNLIKNLGQE